MNPVAPDRLPGVLAHELRNPLASALTGAMLARELVDADDPRAPVLDGVLRDLDRMTALLDGWLTLAGTGRPLVRRIAVAELVRAAASRHGAEVVVCTSDAVVDADAALLGRALDNLCENARQSGARSIRIAVQDRGDEVVVHVEDDGHGVPREQVARIFEPGWSTHGGAGLGLYAVAATLAAHRGSVRCMPLAHGTRFTLSLPAARSRTASA